MEIAPDDWFPMVEPLADATTLDAIERYPWPDMDDPTRVAHMGAEAARFAADVQEGLGRGVRPTVLLFESMIPALDEVGRRFESGEYCLPEMLIAARAMRASMEVLRPHMSATDGSASPPRMCR